MANLYPVASFGSLFVENVLTFYLLTYSLTSLLFPFVYLSLNQAFTRVHSEAFLNLPLNALLDKAVKSVENQVSLLYYFLSVSLLLFFLLTYLLTLKLTFISHDLITTYLLIYLNAS